MPTNPGPSRRMLIIGTAAATGALIAGTGMAGAQQEGHEGSHDGTGGSGASHEKLIKAASDCTVSGERCVAHCIDLIGKEPALKDCMLRVREMLSACAMLTRFASQNSARLKEVAKLCADICDDCEKECRKHEKHHAVCRQCAESCAVCIKECRAILKT